MTHVDGNALAGTFADILGIEVTDAIGQCAGCRHRAALARAQAYATAMGAVVRCEACRGVLAVVVRTPRDVILNLSGLAFVSIARSALPEDS
ncbi:DUF6510 family protein [Microbacterium sp. NPDC077663]|uniref:DUF6510 family protein n=1 Tax=Microbacterium sp. NPDC077663 TaxID=3364189 RepID=UPI0037C58D34